jgi:hypothetical protein
MLIVVAVAGGEEQIWKETRFLRIPDSFAVWWAPS